MLPVRCYTCGKVLGNKEETYIKLKKEDLDNIDIFKKMNITRYCCKRILTTSIDYMQYKLR